MDPPITEEESYADRRQLFKNIWDTGIYNEKKEENKDGNAIHKPKVIKTLRLDEVERCIAGKKKHQRLKHLKIVCNKILDFCDLQDTDDVFYEQAVSKGPSPMRNKRKKTKVRRTKKAKRMFTTMEDTLQAGTTSPDIFLSHDSTFRNSSPFTIADISLSDPEKIRKRQKRQKIVQKLPGAKVLLPACHKYPNKRLFPINKIYID